MLEYITSKPILAVTITQSAFITSLMAWVGILTPIVGLIAAIFGLVVGYYSMRSAYRKWHKEKKHKIKPLHKHE